MKHLMNGFYVEMTPRLSGVDFRCLHVHSFSLKFVPSGICMMSVL